jgi:hypothetical protein
MDQSHAAPAAPAPAPAPQAVAVTPELGQTDIEVPTTTAVEEGHFLNYVGHQIPWYVRLIWILFWCFSIWYVIRLLLPALNTELLSPP